jgi:hypothetical protein
MTGERRPVYQGGGKYAKEYMLPVPKTPQPIPWRLKQEDHIKAYGKDRSFFPERLAATQALLKAIEKAGSPIT